MSSYSWLFGYLNKTKFEEHCALGHNLKAHLTITSRKKKKSSRYHHCCHVSLFHTQPCSSPNMTHLMWILSALYPFFIWELFLSPQHHASPSPLSTAMGMWPSHKTWFSNTRRKRVSLLSFWVEAVRAASSHISDPFTTREQETNMHRHLSPQGSQLHPWIFLGPQSTNASAIWSWGRGDVQPPSFFKKLK